ncbi:hypothetical protein M422DRAFT_242323 [Sphaerobolus stellatus SS14]|nr:hypothetical protein M422DRAFT_242323 [Sphaerobolus stellatus SS14]
MANLVRRAKSGSDWSSNELPAYNITIVERDEQQFFSGPLPLYTGPTGFVQYESHVQAIREGEELTVSDFATEVLRALGYEMEQTVIRTRKALRLSMSSEKVYAKQMFTSKASTPTFYSSFSKTNRILVWPIQKPN